MVVASNNASTMIDSVPQLVAQLPNEYAEAYLYLASYRSNFKMSKDKDEIIFEWVNEQLQQKVSGTELMQRVKKDAMNIIRTIEKEKKKEVAGGGVDPSPPQSLLSLLKKTVPSKATLSSDASPSPPSSPPKETTTTTPNSSPPFVPAPEAPTTTTTTTTTQKTTDPCGRPPIVDQSSPPHCSTGEKGGSSTSLVDAKNKKEGDLLTDHSQQYHRVNNDNIPTEDAVEVFDGQGRTTTKTTTTRRHSWKDNDITGGDEKKEKNVNHPGPSSDRLPSPPSSPCKDTTTPLSSESPTKPSPPSPQQKQDLTNNGSSSFLSDDSVGELPHEVLCVYLELVDLKNQWGVKMENVDLFHLWKSTFHDSLVGFRKDKNLPPIAIDHLWEWSKALFTNQTQQSAELLAASKTNVETLILQIAQQEAKKREQQQPPSLLDTPVLQAEQEQLPVVPSLSQKQQTTTPHQSASATQQHQHHGKRQHCDLVVATEGQSNMVSTTKRPPVEVPVLQAEQQERPVVPPLPASEPAYSSPDRQQTPTSRKQHNTTASLCTLLQSLAISTTTPPPLPPPFTTTTTTTTGTSDRKLPPTVREQQQAPTVQPSSQTRKQLLTTTLPSIQSKATSGSRSATTTDSTIKQIQPSSLVRRSSRPHKPNTQREKFANQQHQQNKSSSSSSTTNRLRVSPSQEETTSDSASTSQTLLPVPPPSSQKDGTQQQQATARKLAQGLLEAAIVAEETNSAPSSLVNKEKPVTAAMLDELPNEFSVAYVDLIGSVRNSKEDVINDLTLFYTLRAKFKTRMHEEWGSSGSWLLAKERFVSHPDQSKELLERVKQDTILTLFRGANKTTTPSTNSVRTIVATNLNSKPRARRVASPKEKQHDPAVQEASPFDEPLLVTEAAKQKVSESSSTGIHHEGQSQTLAEIKKLITLPPLDEQQTAQPSKATINPCLKIVQQRAVLARATEEYSQHPVPQQKKQAPLAEQRQIHPETNLNPIPPRTMPGDVPNPTRILPCPQQVMHPLSKATLTVRQQQEHLHEATVASQDSGRQLSLSLKDSSSGTPTLDQTSVPTVALQQQMQVLHPSLPPRQFSLNSFTASSSLDQTQVPTVALQQHPQQQLAQVLRPRQPLQQLLQPRAQQQPSVSRQQQNQRQQRKPLVQPQLLQQQQHFHSQQQVQQPQIQAFQQQTRQLQQQPLVYQPQMRPQQSPACQSSKSQPQLQPQLQQQQCNNASHPPQIQQFPQAPHHTQCQSQQQRRQLQPSPQTLSSSQHQQQEFERSPTFKEACEGKLDYSVAKELLENGIRWQEHEHIWNQNLTRLQELYQMRLGKSKVNLSSEARGKILTWAKVQAFQVDAKVNGLEEERKKQFLPVYLNFIALAQPTLQTTTNEIGQVPVNNKRTSPDPVPLPLAKRPCNGLGISDRKVGPQQGISPLSVVDDQDPDCSPPENVLPASCTIDLTQNEQDEEAEDDDGGLVCVGSTHGIEDEEDRKLAMEGQLDLDTAVRLIDEGARWEESDQRWTANFEVFNTVITLLKSKRHTGQDISVDSPHSAAVMTWFRVQALMCDKGMLPPHREEKIAKLTEEMKDVHPTNIPKDPSKTATDQRNKDNKGNVASAAIQKAPSTSSLVSTPKPASVNPANPNDPHHSADEDSFCLSNPADQTVTVAATGPTTTKSPAARAIVANQKSTPPSSLKATAKPAAISLTKPTATPRSSSGDSFCSSKSILQAPTATVTGPTTTKSPPTTTSVPNRRQVPPPASLVSTAKSRATNPTKPNPTPRFSSEDTFCFSKPAAQAAAPVPDPTTTKCVVSQTRTTKQRAIASSSSASSPKPAAIPAVTTAVHLQAPPPFSSEDNSSKPPAQAPMIGPTSKKSAVPQASAVTPIEYVPVLPSESSRSTASTNQGLPAPPFRRGKRSSSPTDFSSHRPPKKRLVGERTKKRDSSDATTNSVDDLTDERKSISSATSKHISHSAKPSSLPKESATKKTQLEELEKEPTLALTARAVEAKNPQTEVADSEQAQKKSIPEKPGVDTTTKIKTTEFNDVDKKDGGSQQQSSSAPHKSSTSKKDNATSKPATIVGTGGSKKKKENPTSAKEDKSPLGEAGISTTSSTKKKKKATKTKTNQHQKIKHSKKKKKTNANNTKTTKKKKNSGEQTPPAGKTKANITKTTTKKMMNSDEQTPPAGKTKKLKPGLIKPATATADDEELITEKNFVATTDEEHQEHLKKSFKQKKSCKIFDLLLEHGGSLSKFEIATSLGVNEGSRSFSYSLKELTNSKIAVEEDPGSNSCKTKFRLSEKAFLPPVLVLVDTYDLLKDDPFFNTTITTSTCAGSQQSEQEKETEPYVYDPNKNRVWYTSQLDRSRLIRHTPKMANYYNTT